MAHLFLPRWCPGCGRPGVSVCLTCAAGLSHWFRAEFEAEALDGLLPVWACGAYRAEVQRIILAWKSGRVDLVEPISRLGQRIGHRAAQILEGHSRVLVVPAPSGWRRRWRGHEVVAPLAQAVAEGLQSAGIRASSARILHRRGGRNHRLSREQRLRERATAISLSRRAQKALTLDPGHAHAIVLVDDVLTTGATLAASAAAAAHVGEVVGAIVLAATPKPG